LPSDYPTYKVVLKKGGKSFDFPCHEIFLAQAPYFRSLFDFVERKSGDKEYVPNLEVDNIPAFLTVLLSFYGIDAMDTSTDSVLQAYSPVLKIRRWKDWKRTLLLTQAMDFLGLDYDKKSVQCLSPPEGELEDFQRLISTLPHCGLSQEVISRWGERWREIYVVERPLIKMSRNCEDSYYKNFGNMISGGSIVNTLRRHSSGKIYLAVKDAFYSAKVKEMILPEKKLLCRASGSSLISLDLHGCEFKEREYCNPYEWDDGNGDKQRIVFFSEQMFAICIRSYWENFYESCRKNIIKIWKNKSPYSKIEAVPGRKSFAASGQTLAVIPSSNKKQVVFYSLRLEVAVEPSRAKSKKVVQDKESDFHPLPSKGRKIKYRSKLHPEITFYWTFGKKSKANEGKIILVSEGKKTPNVVMVLDEDSGEILSEIEVEYPILPKGSITHRDKVYIAQNPEDNSGQAYISVHQARTGAKIWELRHSSKVGWNRLFACKDALFCQVSHPDYKSIDSREGGSEEKCVFHKAVAYDIFSTETLLHEETVEFKKIKEIYG